MNLNSMIENEYPDMLLKVPTLILLSPPFALLNSLCTGSFFIVTSYNTRASIQ